MADTRNRRHLKKPKQKTRRASPVSLKNLSKFFPPGITTLTKLPPTRSRLYYYNYDTKKMHAVPATGEVYLLVDMVVYRPDFADKSHPEGRVYPVGQKKSVSGRVVNVRART